MKNRQWWQRRDPAGKPRRSIEVHVAERNSRILTATDRYARLTKRDITYEYTLLAGINDSLEHAKELAELVQGKPCTVNLIPYNPVDGLRLLRPEKEQIVMFRTLLEEKGINTTWRYTKGKDIAAACGQLALQN